MRGLEARLQELVVQQSRELLGHMPGIRNGDPDSIHDARVATRRIRAIVGVLGDDRADHGAFADGMRRLGRALGEVRDLDVAAKLLKETVWQLPSAARAVIALRQAVTQERAGLSRDLIKTVERHPLD